MNRIINISCFLFLASGALSAQFTGGIDDGFALSIFENPANIFSGGKWDGYHSAKSVYASSIFKGGNEDGYFSMSGENPITIYSGGKNNGYHTNYLQNQISIFSGSTESGYTKSLFSNPTSIFSGGNEDGHAKISMILSHFWTGLIDEEWNNVGNWANGLIPVLTSNVVIPANVPHFPYLINAQFYTLQSPSSTSYVCKRLRIRSGAIVRTDSNTFIDNYGTIEIKGSLIMENLSNNAFENQPGGILTLKSGGLFNISQ